VGQSIRLQGNAAYVGINTRLVLAGFAEIPVPPAADPPDPLTALGGTFDIGAGAFEVSFAPSPLGATEHLYVWGCLLQDPSIKFVKNRVRYFRLSSAAATTPVDVEAGFKGRFGAPQVGNGVTFLAQVFDHATGLISVPQRVDGVVVTT
jgi:hypothetical protein